MSCRGDGCNEHGHADTGYEFQPTWCTNDSVHESVFPDHKGDLLSILSHIVASLRMELLPTQMFTPLKAPR